MENVTAPVQTAEEAPTTIVIEVYDIFLTDGTHLRLCTDSVNQDLVDYQL